MSKYNQTRIINNGVNVDCFKPRKGERFFDEFTVGYIGRLDPEKNVENLIIACKELNIPIVLAGPSRLSEHHLRKTYESERVKIFGELDAKYFYGKIDVMASPSLMEANVPRTILEAMASGVPVISGSCGGEEQQIKDSFGILTAPDVESIKKSILKVKNSDYKRMGRRGREEVVKHFNLKDKVRQTEKLYRDACS
jgi:glycosyltransferase involved in cell wall biosynthesis